MLAGADYVVVALPLTSATRHLIDARALEQMPADACLIDVSRGGVVDLQALEVALRAGRLRGAALDVFEEEPLPAESSLWSCPRLLITPHVGGFTPDYLERTLDVFLENVELVKSGKPPRTALALRESGRRGTR
jgi:phosphoglycerate dehydrogenase-like enzyme